jgi:hypothetical protein
MKTKGGTKYRKCNRTVMNRVLQRAVKNKLCVIIGSTGKPLASYPGHDQSEMPLHDEALGGTATTVGVGGVIRLVVGIRVVKYSRDDVEQIHRYVSVSGCLDG